MTLLEDPVRQIGGRSIYDRDLRAIDQALATVNNTLDERRRRRG
jgi:hypothetical protein